MDYVFKQLLTHKDYKLYRGTILNIILVYKGVRPSYLFENRNYGIKGKEAKIILYKIIGCLNLDKKIQIKTTESLDGYERIFIYLDEKSREKINPELYPVDRIISKNKNSIYNDEEVARFLGFFCIGHDFSNEQKDKVIVGYSIKINKDHLNIITEVCIQTEVDMKLLTRHIKLFKKKINNALSSISKKYICTSSKTYESADSSRIRYNKLVEKDFKFIKHYEKKYIDDFVNWYISGNGMFEKSTTYKKFQELLNKKTLDKKDYDKLIKIYKKSIIDNKFDKYYENTETVEEVISVSTDLIKKDKIWWKN